MKKITNLAESFSEEEVKRIVAKVLDGYETDMGAREEWVSKRNRWFELWACQPDDKRRLPWKGAANVTLPLTAASIQQFASRAYMSIFGADDILKVVPTEPNDKHRARRVEQFMNWQMLVEMDEYEEQWDRMLHELPITGTCFKKNYWDFEEQRPVSKFISSIDVVVPYDTQDLKQARRITHRLFQHLEQIERLAEQGFYVNADQVEQVGRQEDEEIRDTFDEIQGTQSPGSEEEPNLVLECHTMCKLEGDKVQEPYIFWVDKASGTLLRAVSRKVRGQEVNYFVDYHFIPNPQGFYSFGFGHFLENLNKVANTIFNQIIDSGRLVNQPFGFYGRRAGFKNSKINLEPGAMYEVTDASQIVFPNMQRLDQSLPSLLQMIDRYIELFTSNTEPVSGRTQKGVREPTARGTMALIEQGLVQFGVVTKRIYRAQRKEFRQLYALNQLFLPTEKQFRVLGDTETEVFASVEKDDFQGKYDLFPTGDPAFASKGQRRQESLEVMQLALQHPLIGAPDPETGKPMNAKALRAFTQDWLRTYDKGGLARELPVEEEPSLPPHVENAAFMQGDTIEPKEGEDHEKHVDAHVTFLQSPVGQDLPLEFQQLIMQHIQATEQLYQQEQQQMEAMQQQEAMQSMQQQMGGQDVAGRDQGMGAEPGVGAVPGPNQGNNPLGVR